MKTSPPKRGCQPALVFSCANLLVPRNIRLKMKTVQFPHSSTNDKTCWKVRNSDSVSACYLSRLQSKAWNLIHFCMDVSKQQPSKVDRRHQLGTAAVKEVHFAAKETIAHLKPVHGLLGWRKEGK